MHPLLAQACAQADQALSLALDRPISVTTRPSERCDLASAAPRALHLDAAPLCAALDLSGTWLSEVTARDGFLNFTLAPEWYPAAAAQPHAPAPLPELPPVVTDFPAAIHPFDWRFLTSLTGRSPKVALAARLDRGNPGALVRLTLQRLEAVDGRTPEQCGWMERERALLLLLARWEENVSPRAQALFLERAAREIWALGPLNLPAPLLRCARGTLNRGCGALLRAADVAYTF